MTEVQLVHSAELDPVTVAAARALLDAAFDDEVTEHDWEHGLGGMHALVWDRSELIGHGSVILRRLMHGGRALRTGYVEAVGVRPDRQRQGVGRAMMSELERIIRGAFELGALGASDEGAAFYTALGWQRWEGPTSAMTPNGIVRTEDEDGCIYVLPLSAELHLAGELTCDWRQGDVW